jgi:hypothetical protein
MDMDMMYVFYWKDFVRVIRSGIQATFKIQLLLPWCASLCADSSVEAKDVNVRYILQVHIAGTCDDHRNFSYGEHDTWNESKALG